MDTQQLRAQRTERFAAYEKKFNTSEKRQAHAAARETRRKAAPYHYAVLTSVPADGFVPAYVALLVVQRDDNRPDDWPVHYQTFRLDETLLPALGKAITAFLDGWPVAEFPLVQWTHPFGKAVLSICPSSEQAGHYRLSHQGFASNSNMAGAVEAWVEEGPVEDTHEAILKWVAQYTEVKVLTLQPQAQAA